MKRRRALKIFGALFIALVGGPAPRKASPKEKKGEGLIDWGSLPDYSKPMNYIFKEAGMGKIIVEKEDGLEISVPFSDITEAMAEPSNLTTIWQVVEGTVELGFRSDGVVVWRKEEK